MHFSNTEKGKRELNKSREIYANHKKLVMVAREEVSYQTMKKEFYENNVIKTPDIVTYLNKNGIDQKRDGALLILRSDIEANLDEQKIKQIEQTTRKYLKNVVYDDTAKGPGILSKYREEKIEEMLIKYRKCQLVITDRLHGMIFAAITSTPCIALGNYNHKIKSCSETLEHLGYIKYVDNVEEIEENIKYLMSNEFEKYDNKFAIEQFKQIKEEAIKLVK
jgi:pyruvyl transferase EpsI